MGYKFRNYKVPDYMMEGLTLYIEHGISPGDFLRAVIENDLMGALGKADVNNIEALPAYAGYLYNEAPQGCYGYKGVIEVWQKHLSDSIC